MDETGTSNLDEGSYELLVAYLDGELDSEQNQNIEKRLADDAAFRAELRQMQFTWDLLDELPRVEASETFTQTTVEMVALSAEQELQQSKTHQTSLKRLRHFVLFGGFAATIVASFFIGSFILSRPNQQLVKDLPVIENWELYRVAGSVEFLEMLDEEQLFSEEMDDGL
jgi:anti-sigma factor RsiW